jgi:hypothetical protein
LLFVRSKAERRPDALRPGLTIRSATCGRLPVLSEVRRRGRSDISAGMSSSCGVWSSCVFRPCGVGLTGVLMDLNRNMPQGISKRAGPPMAFSYAYAYSTLEALCPIILCFLPEVKIVSTSYAPGGRPFKRRKECFKSLHSYLEPVLQLATTCLAMESALPCTIECRLGRRQAASYLVLGLC